MFKDTTMYKRQQDEVGYVDQLSQPKQPARDSEIEAWLTNLNASVSLLEKISQEFKPIIYFIEDYQDAPVNEVCPLANEIRSIDLRVRRIANYLSHHQL